jgi:predicted nucleotidyltransferase component of viral defense system
MIPRAAITEWRSRAPWGTDAQVEQDLVLSRALIEMFGDPMVRNHLAFRGGTALNTLYLHPASRYSEDIDLVQIKGEPIGPVVRALRKTLDPWLGTPIGKRSKSNVTLIYRFESELPPVQPLRLKVEINTREHFSVLGFENRSFAVDNLWMSGTAQLQTYPVEELLGTKFRALYQRRKGRDLFDLDEVLNRHSAIDDAKIVNCFHKYLAHEKLRVSRAQYEANMHEKLKSADFGSDIAPLLRPGVKFDMKAAYDNVHARLISKLSGAPWKITR